jgi:hypothetical protein
MNKLLKKSTLSIILLTTTFQTIPTPCEWHFILWPFGTSQQQENSDQAPVGVTENDYIAQFISDMNGQSCVIPLNEMQEMITAIRQNLRNIDSRDKDLANQIIRAVACNQAKMGTKKDMLILAREEGHHYTQEEYETIPASYENNVRVRLESIPHNLNGLAIAQYYGEERKAALRRDYQQRNGYRRNNYR